MDPGFRGDVDGGLSRDPESFPRSRESTLMRGRADIRYDLGRIYVRHVVMHEEYDRRTADRTLCASDDYQMIVAEGGRMPTVLDFTKPRVLRTEAEYEAAVAEIDSLLDAEPAAGSEAYDRLEFLSVLVEAYDTEHYPMPSGDVSPQAAVEFILEQKGLDRTALYEAMGGKSRVSEFFSGKRELSRGQIEALRELLGVPADLLL
jgi:HTH-type transcriptional regulator / antitoxin HigA